MSLVMKSFATSAILLLLSATSWPQHALVLQSDFGNKDAAVPSMKGVAVGVSADIDIYDLTHEIPVFNIWEASLRLVQTAPYWPPGTVFVSVVDPGVGTERLSVVLKTDTGHYFVSPDNGSLTAVAEEMGIASVREIDEAVNRLKNSEMSYTFHGRDVYAYTGARLAAGVITFEQVGRELPAKVLSIPYQKASFDKRTVSGNIPVLDIQYGNIWTNIDRAVFQRLGAKPGDDIDVRITQGDKLILQETMPYFRSFGAVATGETLLYLNSLNDVSLAINQGSFADHYGIQSGADWNIFLTRSQSR